MELQEDAEVTAAELKEMLATQAQNAVVTNDSLATTNESLDSLKDITTAILKALQVQN